MSHGRRNILPGMTDSYLKSCHRGNDPLCPIFRLGDVVRDAGEKFPEMAVEVPAQQPPIASFIPFYTSIFFIFFTIFALTLGNHRGA